jgi:hypothetical protein
MARRTEVIQIRLTEAEKASLEAIAARYEVTVSELVRNRLIGLPDVGAPASTNRPELNRPAAAPSPRMAPRVGRAARSGGFDGPGNPD